MLMLRVLVVLPLYGGSLPVGRFCIEGLREAGCLVESFAAPSFYGAYSALNELKVRPDRLGALQNSFLQVLGQAVLAKVEAFGPDLVLAMAQAPLSRVTLKRLRQDKVATAMWFVEDFRLFTYWRAFAPQYDIFAVIQKEPFLSELRAIGVDNALYLPLAALPDFHRPLQLGPQEKKEFGAGLSFMGAGYPNRRKAFVQLRDFGLKIWGTEWDDAPLLAPLLQRGGARVSPEDCVRIYNGADINLNLHSSVQADSLVSHGDFVNPRTFEIASCGAFQLVDERELLPELFSEDEMATFSDMDSLRDAIISYRQSPEKRAAMAAKARARVLAEHSYAARMRSLLDFARSRLTGFAQRKAAAWPEEMPEDMQKAMDALMHKLHLPESAGFDDIVAAVRAGNEPLDDAEAALLFLDEWRKLYLR
ncbi:glycosyltransferase [Desulfovibrio sp. OttesenSCG-928-A18]|nr:glycosyltransferase [Desulfovibrio sp. OttesenSCG-928-A18]